MKLYREVIIETVEQVETLAEAAFLVDSIDGQVYFDAPEGSSYEGEFVDADGNVVFASDLVGCTAYIPVETEEEWGGSRPNGEAWECQDRSHAEDDVIGWNKSAGPDGFQSTLVRRLNTPWEEA